MSIPWLSKRRRRGQRALGAQEPPPPAHALNEQGLVRTQVTISKGRDKRAPRTVITLRRVYKRPHEHDVAEVAVAPAVKQKPRNSAYREPSFTTKTMVSCQPPQKPTIANISDVRIVGVDGHEVLQVVEPEAACLEEAYGIEEPASPPSTLRSDYIIKRWLESTPRSLVSSGTADSFDTAATHVDDGLSDWGLPKTIASAFDVPADDSSSVGASQIIDVDTSLDVTIDNAPVKSAPQGIAVSRPRTLPVTTTFANDATLKRVQKLLSVVYIASVVNQSQSSKAGTKQAAGKPEAFAEAKKARAQILHGKRQEASSFFGFSPFSAWI